MSRSLYRDNPEARYLLKERETRFTLVTVADVLRNTPGLAKHVGGDDSVSVVNCSEFKYVATICAQSTPCVAVADISFLAPSGLANFAPAADLKRTIGVLIVVDEDDARLCQKLLRMGFAGVIQRSAPAAVFRRALDVIAQGELWASRKTISALVREFLSEASSKRLTSREKEILGFLVMGLKNLEIADSLFVSRETVRWHLRRIYSKLQVADRKRAIEYVLAEGMILAVKPSLSEGGGGAQRRVCS